MYFAILYVITFRAWKQFVSSGECVKILIYHLNPLPGGC